MKILGRIKKSKVLTAVMTAVLILQSACPTGLTVPSSPRWHWTFLTATPNPRFSTDFLSAAKHAANPVRNRAFRLSPVSTKSMSASTSRS